MPLSRRSLLTAAAAGAPLFALPRLALAAAETERRLVFVILRGAMDGLGAVAPVGDPAYAAARGALAQAGPATVGGLFAFHPALAGFADLYAARQALIVHAVASPYRDRSHFDGQNVLETGGASPYELKDGWLNRLLPLLPGGRRAIAVAPAVPPVLRGAVAVESYAPSRLPDPTPDYLDRIALLYRDDALLHPLWEKAMEARRLAAGTAAGSPGGGAGALAGLADIAAAFLTRPAGPRIAVLDADGWDTHSGQQGRLANQLKGLDAALTRLKTGLGASWADTLVVAATEFGRTVAVNGTGGTDHGTGGAALLAGGAVLGGRVLADWPGLSPNVRLDGRDLRPTADLRSVLLAAAVHMGAEPGRAARALFPDAAGLRAAELLG